MCLVLALKEATQTPFLALDEFDVFMDNTNRRLSLEILIKACMHVCVDLSVCACLALLTCVYSYTSKTMHNISG